MTVEAHAWAHGLDTLYDQAWHRLVRGVHDRHASARHPTLATVSADGHPAMRTVVLRSADRLKHTLEIHTSLHSAKMADLKRTPLAAVHVWDAGQRLQIRIQAEVQWVTWPDNATTWNKVPEPSRAAYSAQVPGTPIADSLSYTRQPDPAAFVVLILHMVSMDLLHLGTDHRRAVYSRQNGWAGQWLPP